MSFTEFDCQCKKIELNLNNKVLNKYVKAPFFLQICGRRSIGGLHRLMPKKPESYGLLPTTAHLRDIMHHTFTFWSKNPANLVSSTIRHM